METRLFHPSLGNCFLKFIDNTTYSLPMAVVYSDKAGEDICKPLIEFELAPNTLCDTNSMVFRYLIKHSR